MSANSSGSDVNLPNFEGKVDSAGAGWSDELDYLPLIRRRNLLLAASKQKSKSLSLSLSLIGVAVPLKEEEDDDDVVDKFVYESQDVFTFPLAAREVGVQLLEEENNQYSIIPTGTTSGVLCSKTVADSSLDQCLHHDSCSQNVEMSGGSDYNENSGHSTFDHLDHISLKERQEMLQSRKLLGLEKPVMEGIPGPLSKDLMQQLTGQAETSNVGGEALVATNSFDDNPRKKDSVLCSTSMTSTPYKSFVGSSFTTDEYSSNSNKPHDGKKSSESGTKCSSERMPPNAMELSPCSGQVCVPAYTNRAHSSTSSASVKLKDEPWDDGFLHNMDINVKGNFSLNTLRVKNEPGVFTELNEDELDHMRLRDRMNLLASGYGSELSMSRNDGSLVKIVPSAKYSPIALESAKPINLIRPRKRRKTATVSVETALEEDAPGLLQVLIEKGVLVNEIRLYGEVESDDALDESLCENSFANLEAVISKLFSQRPSVFKFASIRCTKGSRASYCLACLISLVEQTRYLRFRNWPVEWGWCRDLQSFIFVFERHNRIVLERPEYGYATYFFETVVSLPIGWQIKRLVTAMKLTSCSRNSLIENKALTVGEDLTEGEAEVLMEYGWEPSTGLATMLKYRDRVVHDRKNENDSAEWRSKIGKLLMDGYNGGSLVTSNIPKKVLECRDYAQSSEIKLEP